MTPTPKRPDLWPRPAPAGPGQESVWDYPRPPRLEQVRQEVRVEFGGRLVGQSARAFRILETSLAPAYYLPPEDVDSAALRPSARRTFCEWKGEAAYFDVLDPADGKADHAADAAFAYPEPLAAFAQIAGYISFYPGLVACFVGGERARPQPGNFYSGWITSSVTGPFKGAPGSRMW